MPAIEITSIQQLINAVQDVMLTVPGIRKAPDYAPETLEGFPFSAVYLEDGHWEMGPGYGAMTGRHNIIIEVHVARKNLPTDLREAMRFSVSVPKAFRSPTNYTLGGLTDGIGPIMPYKFGPLSWGVTDTLGFKFTLSNIKVILST